MNKYIIIAIVLVLIISGGAFYRAYFVAEIDKPVVTGVERSVSIVTFENTWRFEPELLEVDQGDRLTMTVTNQDEYDHGFAIDAFGISQRMPALETIVIDFVVTKAGDFPYYCSVSCGSGIVDGEKRGHFDQIGKLHVRSLISETSGLGPIISNEDFAKQAREAGAVAPANEKAIELGFDPEALVVTFDEGNTLWEIYVNSENIDKGDLNLTAEQEYQAILYRDSGSNPVLWVFIDSVEGEVLNYLIAE